MEWNDWRPIEKRRYIVMVAGMKWEIDEFQGENAGLVVAEIELMTEHQSIVKPGWVGVDVSQDRRYFNAYLAQHPYCSWGKAA